MCTFGNTFNCLEPIIPEDINTSFAFSLCECETKKIVFPNVNALLQHCDTSNDWKHKMLGHYLRELYPKTRFRLSQSKSRYNSNNKRYTYYRR